MLVGNRADRLMFMCKNRVYKAFILLFDVEYILDLPLRPSSPMSKWNCLTIKIPILTGYIFDLS